MIYIADFGSQTAHLIGRRLKDIGVSSTVVDPEFILEAVKKHKPTGIILSGGPASVYEKGSPTITKKIFTLGIPVLGICYGWQLTAKLLGGTVKSSHKEYGPGNLEVESSTALLKNVDSYSRVWMSHGDSVIKLPEGFEIIAKTNSLKSAAVYDKKRNIYGVQFHPEVEHTVFGTEILKNFAVLICKEKIKKHTISVEDILTSIKDNVGNGNVICAVSGGVDSTVAAMLVGRAIGKKLHPVYIESGLMREGTAKEVTTNFQKYIGVKPLIIGKLYIELFDQAQKKMPNVTHLMQGTIYSDVIESKGSKNADKIKSHHNVGGLPEEMKLKLIEPLRNFYKDEVRLIGTMIGLPEDIVHKQVFPGPGQAIRIVGEVTEERLMRQHKADVIVIEEIKKAGLYKKIYMSFPVMTNTVSTAVKGDGRQLLEVVALRVIESQDIMTTDWAKLPYDLLQSISSRIVNEVQGVSRVVYDITTKPPATMEWE